ncbi:helix-turn-helix domain containing protein [Streptomyces sp. NBC_00996]|uniref:helix-turn-helix domain containing protein n=1 Tax=Streptomyces sp. NBC_00996 TaxID=2903710 RepID=UPI003867FCAA|nr:helix-turn-helix domain containing protein [Streptomyces sp. NBC_00996]
MALVDEEERRRAERAHQVALFRYQLIREAADPALSPRQRGAMVRELAARTHTDPFGRQITVGRGTLDRWLRNWREGGFDALLPPTRQVTPRTPEEVLDLAAALKRENPSRTTAQVVRILTQHLGWGPSCRTVHRHLGRLDGCDVVQRPRHVGFERPQLIEFSRLADVLNWPRGMACVGPPEAS